MQGLGGLRPGLNRGASMSGNKPDMSSDNIIDFREITGGNGSNTTLNVVAAVDCVAHCFVYGAGGVSAYPNPGGAGGEARYGRIALRKGDTLALLAALYNTTTADGGSSSASAPNGTIVAGGGRSNGTLGSLTGSGGETARPGGLTGVLGNDGSAATPGGGAGGLGSGSSLGGGGGAGFGDWFPYAIGGRGAGTGGAAQLGGGAGNSEARGPGRVLVFLIGPINRT